MGKETMAVRPWVFLQEMKRELWRRWLRLRFLLWHRHRYNRMVLEQVAGHPLVVLPQVFNPALFRTGEFLALTLNRHLVPPGSTVLDLGTGSGIGAIVAARWASRVLAVDINAAAVRCARINVLLNEVENRVEIRQGDLFGPVKDEKFHRVLFNPPFFRGEPATELDKALRAVDVLERFVAGLRDHLQPYGASLVCMSTDGDVQGFLQAVQLNGFSWQIVAERDLINEILTVYRLVRIPLAEIRAGE